MDIQTVAQDSNVIKHSVQMFCNLYPCLCPLGRGSLSGRLKAVGEEEEGSPRPHCPGSSQTWRDGRAVAPP